MASIAYKRLPAFGEIIAARANSGSVFDGALMFIVNKFASKYATLYKEEKCPYAKSKDKNKIEGIRS